MDAKPRARIAIRTTRGSNGFLSLLFVAACIAAFALGDAWFRIFVAAAVAGGLAVAAIKQRPSRVARDSYRSQRAEERELD